MRCRLVLEMVIYCFTDWLLPNEMKLSEVPCWFKVGFERNFLGILRMQDEIDYFTRDEI